MNFLRKLPYYIGGFSIMNQAYKNKNSVENLYQNQVLESFGGQLLITDDEDNIGVKLVLKLAPQNTNIILVTRNPEIHKELQQAVLEKYNTTLKLVKFDFKLDDKKQQQQLQQSLMRDRIKCVIMTANQDSSKILNDNNQESKEKIAENIQSKILLSNYLLYKLKNQDFKSMVVNISHYNHEGLEGSCQAGYKNFIRALQFDSKVDFRQVVLGPLNSENVQSNDDDQFILKAQKQFNQLFFETQQSSLDSVLIQLQISNKKLIYGSLKEQLYCFTLKKLGNLQALLG